MPSVQTSYFAHGVQCAWTCKHIVTVGLSTYKQNKTIRASSRTPEYTLDSYHNLNPLRRKSEVGSMWADIVKCNVLRLPCRYCDCSVMYSVRTVCHLVIYYDCVCLSSSDVESQGNWWTGIGKRLEGSDQNTKHFLKLVTVLFGCAHLCLLQISVAFKASDNLEVPQSHSVFVLRYTDILHMPNFATSGSPILCSSLWHFSSLYGNLFRGVGNMGTMWTCHWQ